MKLSKIKIENFRLLENVILDLDSNMTLLVGKNNSGKTSFMNLLSLINDNKTIVFDDYPVSYRKKLYDNIYSYLKSEITYNELIKTIKITSMTFYVNYKEDVDSDNFGYLSNFIIDIDESVTDAVISTKYIFNISKDKFKNIFNLNLENKEESLNKIKKILHEKYSSFLKLVVYAINPKLEDDFLIKEQKEFVELFKIYKIDAERPMGESEINVNSPFGTLLSKLFDEDIDSAFSDMKSQIEKLQEYVIEGNESAQNIVDESLSEILKKSIRFGYPNEKKIELKAHSNIQLENQIKKNTDLRYLDNDSNEILPNSYNGLGYKNLLKIEFELAAFAREMSNYSKSVIPILFIEEPESHMHPQIQQRFIQYINDYINDFDYSDIQVIITTHSSHISSQVDFDKIRYAKRNKNSVNYKNLDTFSDFDDTNLKFIKKYLELTKCDMFFADKIILVEGASERLLMSDMIDKCYKLNLFKKNKIPLVYQYYTIIEVGGAYAHKFLNFIDFLEIPTLIITDIDSVKGEQTEKGIKYKKCLVSDGELTSNATIKAWINNNEKISIKELLSLNPEEKTNKFKHIEFQVKEKKYCGRSFEESIMNVNRDIYNLGVDDIIEFDSDKTKKTDFALELLENEDYNIPKYIKDGLIWLNDINCDSTGDDHDK